MNLTRLVLDLFCILLHTTNIDDLYAVSLDDRHRLY